MKNRFFVINKEKIYAYVVSIMTVVVIFFMSSMMNSDLKETEEVSSNETKYEQNSEIGEAVSTSVSNMEEENTNSNETENKIEQ